VAELWTLGIRRPSSHFRIGQPDLASRSYAIADISSRQDRNTGSRSRFVSHTTLCKVWYTESAGSGAPVVRALGIRVLQA
jgi:hypothetical protein